jgi:hypothetical protein
MVERAALIARAWGFWGLHRGLSVKEWRRLIFWVLQAGKDETARPKAIELLRAAEMAAAKRVILELQGATSKSCGEFDRGSGASGAT